MRLGCLADPAHRGVIEIGRPDPLAVLIPFRTDAALIRRMVLSTLHTNSAEGAITRMRDLGVPDYILNDVLRGILAQRLEPGAQGQRLGNELVKSPTSESAVSGGRQLTSAQRDVVVESDAEGSAAPHPED